MKAAFTVIAMAAIAMSAPLAAQGPDGPPPGGMERSGAASMFLAHTGELKLTDAQVTRLAGIARRSADRHAAMRGSADSMMRTMQSQQSSNSQPGQRPMAPTPAMRTQMEKMRTANHDDLRDAIAVLTPDQQATVFEMNMRRGGGQRMRGRMMRNRGQGGRGMRGPDQPGPGMPMPSMRRQPPPADSGGRRTRPAPPRQPEP